MSTAKDLILRPIDRKTANNLIKKIHYSGKVVQNSTIHIGVFWQGKLEGAMQFGSSLDKSKLIGLVEGTRWNEFIELNRMAFSDKLPRNSESRAIAIALRILKKQAQHLKWVISYADACLCGDGAIYRASGFVLTGIKKNTQNFRLPFAHEIQEETLIDAGLSNQDIKIIKAWVKSITPITSKMSLEGAPHAHKMSLEGGVRPNQLLSEVKKIMRKITNGGTNAKKFYELIGGMLAIGYQLRYIYFLDKTYRDRLTVDEIPFTKIKEIGASMYKGMRLSKVLS